MRIKTASVMLTLALSFTMLVACGQEKETVKEPVETVKEVEEPAEPVEEVEEPAEPATEVEEPAEPATEAEEPEEPVKEVEEPAEPVKEAEKPAETVVEPVEPVETAAAPVQENVQPEAPQPVENPYPLYQAIDEGGANVYFYCLTDNVTHPGKRDGYWDAFNACIAILTERMNAAGYRVDYQGGNSEKTPYYVEGLQVIKMMPICGQNNPDGTFTICNQVL